MIIGNNNFKKTNNFINNQNHNTNNTNELPTLNTQNIMQNSNIMNSEDMKNRSFAMLNERLRNGTITIEEFNKKCKQLGKQSKN